MCGRNVANNKQHTTQIRAMCFKLYFTHSHWSSTLYSDSHSSTTPWSIANMFPHLQWSHLYLWGKCILYKNTHCMIIDTQQILLCIWKGIYTHRQAFTSCNQASIIWYPDKNVSKQSVPVQLWKCCRHQLNSPKCHTSVLPSLPSPDTHLCSTSLF